MVMIKRMCVHDIYERTLVYDKVWYGIYGMNEHSVWIQVQLW